MAAAIDRPANAADSTSTEASATSATRRVIVIAADRALFGLLREWLADSDYSIEEEGEATGMTGFNLAIVDVPFPRQGGAQLIARVGRDYPGVPILALSSCFFGDVECQGQVARNVGVQSVLPKPVARERLVAAVDTLLRPDQRSD